MNMRTPLSRVRGLGSAKEGTEHFWRQRLTAVANIPLTIFLVWLMVSLHGASYSSAIAMLSSPLVAIGLLFCVASMLYHMRLGMQVVIEDYLHYPWFKVPLLVISQLGLFALAIACIVAVLKVAAGA